MRTIQGIEFYNGSREELLPGFSADFPYISTRAELGTGIGPSNSSIWKAAPLNIIPQAEGWYFRQVPEVW